MGNKAVKANQNVRLKLQQKVSFHCNDRNLLFRKMEFTVHNGMSQNLSNFG